MLCLDAKDAGEDGVEGAHPHVAGIVGVDEFDDTVFHLTGGLVGEGQRHDREGVDAFGDHVGDAVGEGAGLARAGAGDDHHGAIDSGDGLALGFIKLVENI